MSHVDMNQDHRENLSAGMDGELSKEQLRFLLRRLDHDASLQQTWMNYHVVRDGLRRQLPPMASDGFAARVMQAIEHEALPVMVRRSHWLRWSAGGAIAASVAAAALMIAQPAGTEVERTVASTTVQASTANTASASKAAIPAAVPAWLSGNSAGLLSQQASATRGSLFGESQPASPVSLSGYPPSRRYRTLDNNDGSYLLLLDPEPQTMPGSLRQAGIAH